jgi:hypothetical protein
LRYDRITELKERNAGELAKTRMGPGHWVRVAFFIVLAGAAAWYGKQGVNNPFTGRALLSVSGDGDGFTVACVTGRKPRVVSEFTVSSDGAGQWYEDKRSASDGGGVFHDIYPFADSVRAVLLKFAKSDILICDSSVFSPRPAGTRSHFWEKSDLLLIPPASEAEIMEVRTRFRPRMLAVVPPCNMRSTQNVICSETGANGAFRYDFEIKRGVLRPAEREAAE